MNDLAPFVEAFLSNFLLESWHTLRFFYLRAPNADEGANSQADRIRENADKKRIKYRELNGRNLVSAN